MPCVLRINGPQESIQRYVKRDFIPPEAIFDEGVNILVSDAALQDFQGQIQDAVSFLEHNGEQLYEICLSFGMESLCLDFGLAQTDDFVLNYYFPHNLLLLAGHYQIDIELSLYPVSNE